MKYLRKKLTKKRFNVFICLCHIKTAFFRFEIFSRIQDGMVAKVFLTGFSSVLKISRGNTEFGNMLYIVCRGRANKTGFLREITCTALKCIKNFKRDITCKNYCENGKNV